VSRESTQDLVRDLSAGRLSRRDFMRRATALGLSAGAAASLLEAAVGPVPTYAAPAHAGTLKGQLVIALNSNIPSTARDALTKAYNARQPGVKLVWDNKNYNGPADYQTFLGTQLAAGNVKLDIVSGNYDATFRDYVNFDEYRKTINPYTGHTWDQDLNWDFFRGVNSLDQRIMLATQAVHINWFYNKDLFAKAKVDPPQNWSQFVDVCAKLASAGITPVASNYDYMVPQWFAEVYFDQYHIGT
jgi:raffinose/stachyose/melibiose transport system substrate-binding protein